MNTRNERLTGLVRVLKTWKPASDAAYLCSYVDEERLRTPPIVYRYDHSLGRMERVIFGVPLSYLTGQDCLVPEAMTSCIQVCRGYLDQKNWEVSEVAKLAKVRPYLDYSEKSVNLYNIRYPHLRPLVLNK